MVEVICDTSFLIHLATRRIRNIDRLDEEIGPIVFVVPEVVRTELSRLAKNPTKNNGEIRATMSYADGLKTVPIAGRAADGQLVKHVTDNRSMVATMDRQLKRRIKKAGGTVISFSGDRIVLE